MFEEQFSFKVLDETAGNVEVAVTAKWFERVLAKVGLPFYVIILVLIISLLKLLLEASARGLCCLSTPGIYHKFPLLPPQALSYLQV